MTLTKKVKAEARRLGFDFVAVTQPHPPASFPVYMGWLEAGRHAEMAYLATDRARKRRADLHQILPEVESVLILGLHHPSPESAPPPEADRPHGRLAAYAWGDDYHEVFPPRLQALVTFIEAEVDREVPHRWYTDTGPILERDLAQRAGLGWIGKNSMLINPQAGSYLLLAELFLGLALDPDPSFTSDHCGSCTRCLEACPTDCILPDRTLDSARCISYLTIELKGPIPSDLRPQMGDWVFGCDVCQQVCPWNLRFAPPHGDPAFAPRPQVPRVDLEAELALSPEAFNRKFKGSPAKRPKRRGYLRNVAVALGNAADPGSVPALERALLEDPEPLIRGHAAWALGRIGGETAQQALRAAIEIEEDDWVLEEIKAALAA